MAARSEVDAMRATARDGRDADEASPIGAGAAGRYSGDGARWERAAARGRDGGAAWRAPWERMTVGWDPVGAGRGTDGAGKRASVDAMHRRGRRLFAQADKHRRNTLLQHVDELLVHFEHLL